MTLKPPNYTQIPNAILDTMHLMAPSEFKVMMAICRRTFGWQKSEDVISLSQLERLTGLSRTAVHHGIAAGIERGMLEQKKLTPQQFSYKLLVVSDYQYTETTSSGGGRKPVASDYQSPQTTSSLSGPPPVVSVDQQLVVSDYSQKKGLNKLKENDGGARARAGSPPPLFKIKDDEGTDDGGMDDDTGDDDYDPVESLIEIEFAAVQAIDCREAYVAAGVPLDAAEVARIAAYVADNPRGKQNPHAFLASQWRLGKVVPLGRAPAVRPGPAWDRETQRFEPQPASISSDVIEAARRIREEIEARSHEPDQYVGPGAMAAVLAGSPLKHIARAPLAFPGRTAP